MTIQENTFDHLGIAPRLLEILHRLQFTIPTPIQQKSIPVALEGKDIIGVAQTGTGKTLAFGIPMIQRLAQVRGRGLVILPTRELAVQVDETFQKIGRPIGLRTAILIGGASMEMQMRALRKNPHVIIGTPGRILDHLQKKTAPLHDVTVLVLDEADRMLDMGFAPQINEILKAVPKERQTMLFSATMPDDIVRIASRSMKLPVRVEIAPTGSMADRVEQELYVVAKDQKDQLLDKILTQYQGSVLVFTRTKFAAKRVSRTVRSMGHQAVEIHSNRTLAQRREALDGFKSGKYRVLVATDIAARGIDVVGIELVINYDIPEHPEDYVHRIGRTGRAGSTGTAISFASRDQGGAVRDIEKFVRVALPVTRLPELPPARPRVQMEPDRPMGGGSGWGPRPMRPRFGGGGGHGGGQRRGGPRRPSFGR